MQFSQLEGFVAIARSGSFTEGAQELFITQPALTMRIKQLEAQLGCSLFHRQSTGTTLTKLGEVFLPYAEQALRALSAGAAEVASAISDGDRNRLRIGCANVASEYVLPGMIAAFAESHADVLIQVFTGRSEEVADLVRSGEIDVGITRRMPNTGLVERALYEDELILVVPPGHELAGEHLVETCDLLKYKIIVHDRFSAFEWGVSESFLVLLRSLDTIETDSTATAKAMMRQGLGVAVLPRVAVPELLAGTLVEVPLRPGMRASYVEVLLRRPGALYSDAQRDFENLLVRAGELRSGRTGAGER